MTAILAIISTFIINTISGLGYAGVALLMALESAAVPLPSEIIMPFSGFLVSQNRFTLFLVSLAGAIGSTIGAVALFYVGLYGGRPFLEKYGKYFLITNHDLHLAEKFFKKYGVWSLFLGRILPIVRTYISLPAGIAKVNLWLLAITSFIGSFIWSYFLAYLGFSLGQHWEILSQYFHKFDFLIGAIIVLGIIYWIKRHLRIKNNA
ncbi:MAG: DedA family protein [bacterium]